MHIDTCRFRRVCHRQMDVQVDGPLHPTPSPGLLTARSTAGRFYFFCRADLRTGGPVEPPRPLASDLVAPLPPLRDSTLFALGGASSSSGTSFCDAAFRFRPLLTGITTFGGEGSFMEWTGSGSGVVFEASPVSRLDPSRDAESSMSSELSSSSSLSSTSSGSISLSASDSDASSATWDSSTHHLFSRDLSSAGWECLNSSRQFFNSATCSPVRGS